MRKLIDLLMNLNYFGGIKNDVPLSESVSIGRIVHTSNTSIPALTPILINSATKTKHKKKSVSKPPISFTEEPVFGLFKKKSSPKVSILTYFPPNGHCNVGNSSIVAENDIQVMDTKQLLDDHQIKTIDKFDFGKLEEISEYAKLNGVITFRLQDPDAVINFFKNIAYISDLYKYNIFPIHNTGGYDTSSIHDDILITTVSFFDMPYAIPVYNTKKIDGLGIRICTFWENLSKAERYVNKVDDMYLVVSKSPDNILYVDGQDINSPNFVKGKTINRICDIMQMEKKRQKTKLIKKKETNETERKGATPHYRRCSVSPAMPENLSKISVSSNTADWTTTSATYL